ncbi:MAG: antibiotic biosynthesis monooxygenase [Lachnospiraceae bacterium]|nr:antibiotic biosynthesis monooxygenase [Lachnospiraceae bacterium]
MLKVFAKMLVKEGCVEEFKATAKELIAKSQAEEGNIYYTLNESTADPRVLAFVECWKSKEALEIHEKTEHFTTIQPKLGALCEQSFPAELLNEVEY